jgi:putative DNA primase/helicase
VSYHFDRIPDELKQDPSWVLWHKKQPYQANRRRAATDNPDTWTTFEEAIEAYERDDFFDGATLTPAPTSTT